MAVEPHAAYNIQGKGVVKKRKCISVITNGYVFFRLILTPNPLKGGFLAQF